MTEHLPEPEYGPPRMPSPPRRRRTASGKVGRVVRIVGLSLLAFVVVAIVAAEIWLHTGTGEQELGRFAANEARLAIQGDLRVRDIRVGGFLHVCLEGVELRDPEGHKVLAADRACVTLRPLALRSRRIVVSQAQLLRPWVEIAKVPGTSETTLSRAIAPRKKSTTSGPFEWIIDVRALELRGGSVTVRPELEKPASFALADLDISQAHALYAKDGAAAALQLAAQLAAPGRLPIGLALDATLTGPAATGLLTLRSLSLKLGESGLSAAGSWDLSRQAGALRLSQLLLAPKDVAELTHRELLSGQVRGEAELNSDGKAAVLDLRLQGGGGTVRAKATSTLEKLPLWDLQLAVDALDPGAVTPLAPRGQLSARASLHGKGAPQFDVHGVRGDLQGAIHVGPARLETVGPVLADLKASLQGREAIIQAFTATALGMQIKAKGEAAYDELSLDLDVNAPSLAEVGRAAGALSRKKSLPLAGSMRLLARVTGSPQRPDAQVHLRAPKLRWNPTVAVDGLSVDGTLHGKLREPDGMLRIVAQRVSAGAVDLGAPRIAMDLAWPIAHLRIDAGVSGGALQLAGDATIDDDRDGLILSHFLVGYPGNELRLTREADVHFRDQIIVEPFELVGDHGGLRFQAQVHPPPGRIDAALVVTKFELDRLPEFLLPKELGLRGVLDANVVVQGPRAEPDLDLRADLKTAGAKRAGDLAVDGHAHAHLHGGRVQTDGWAAAQSLLRLDWNGEVPVESIAEQPNAPLQLEAHFSRVDIARLADAAKLSSLQQKRAHGIVEARLTATGTLAAPHATLSIEAGDIGTETIQQVDARAGLLLEKGKIELDATLSLAGAEALGLTARAPFDLLRAYKDRAYLRGALERALTAELAVTQLDLARLAKSGLLPAGSAGRLSLSARLSGTPVKPQLQMTTVGEEVTVGRLHGLAFQGELGIADKVKLTLGAQAQGDVVARLDASASLSGAELEELAQHRDDPETIAALLDRSVAMTLDIPGLPIARASQLAGRGAFAEGRLTGRVSLSGTPARPRMIAKLNLKDLSQGKSKLGAMDLYLEAEQSGALLHLGIDPPGGGNFLGHASLKADLGARTLLRKGLTSVLDGQLSGRMEAKRLDVGFLSGLLPNLRRAGGTLDGELKMAGLLSRPTAQGEAHLRRAMFDVVGQGVFEDVSLDASFSPKEVLVDRLTGSLGTGTYSAVLVASRPAAPDAASADRIEFTGEVHLGDDESVRDRKTPQGLPLRAGPVPLRQASEQRADLSGELDLFGDYTDGVLTVNSKIPNARLVIRQLPDKKLPSLKPNPDVLLLHPGEKPHPPGMEPEDVEEEARKRANATFRLHAHLELQQLYVKAEDFEFPVESEMNFDYDARHPDEPSAEGTVHVPTGSFSALGRRFAIADAKIIETGGDITAPELDVKARYENPQANVTITITGTAKDPQLDMSSSPPMDKDAIAFFIATGRVQGRATQQGGGVDLSSAATSVLGSLLFGEVRKELQSVLPVDVLTIETGAQGVSQASIGKYIGDRVFVGYRQRLVPAPTENTEEGRIEYQISRSFSAEATLGDRNSDVSVLYTRDF